MNRRDVLRLCAATVAAPLFLGTARAQGGRSPGAVLASLLPAVLLPGESPKGMDIEERMAHYRTPGLGLAILDEGRVVLERGFGTTSPGGRPVGKSTLFQACSVSKPVAALGVLLAAAQADIGIEQDLTRVMRSWRPPFAKGVPQGPVTLGELLSHTAGINQPGFPGYPAGARLPSLLQILNGKPPANTGPIMVTMPPGGQFAYSGGGYLAAQVLAEQAAGREFAELMRVRVLKPLAMEASAYGVPPPSSGVALAHGPDGHPVPGGWNRYPELAPAALWTTPGDVALFCLAMSRAWKGDGGGPVPVELAGKMLTDRMTRTGPAHWGLGPELVGGFFLHRGSNHGYKCLFAAHPVLGQGVVVMTNGENGADLAAEVLRGVSHVYGWNAFKPERAAPSPDAARLMAEAEGDYRADSGADLDIRKDGDILACLIAGNPVPVPLYPSGEDTLLARGNFLSGDLRLWRGPDGRVSGMTVRSGDVTRRLVKL